MSDKSIFDVLADAQKAMESPKLDCVNPHFKSKYASLGECERVVKEACANIGVFFHYDTYTDAGGNDWLCTVVHYGDQCLRLCPVRISFSGKPQERGSEITYCRRYSLCGAFALAADEDDDGNAAQGAKQQPKAAKPKQSRADRIAKGKKALMDISPWTEETLSPILGNLAEEEQLEWLMEAYNEAKAQLNG